MTKNQMKKYVEKAISKIKDLGLDINKVTNGKTIDQITHNKTTFNIFKKLEKRQKEQIKIREENKEYDRKFHEKKERQQRREMLTPRTERILKFNTESKPNKKNAKLHAQMEVNKFLNRYFQPVKDDKKVKNAMTRIQRKFGNRLDLVHDFIDKVADMEYKYPMSKDTFKAEYPDEYHDNIVNRIYDFESILINEFKL